MYPQFVSLAEIYSEAPVQSGSGPERQQPPRITIQPPTPPPHRTTVGSPQDPQELDENRVYEGIVALLDAQQSLENSVVGADTPGDESGELESL
jgi:hypothetical protein